ncbi:MAG TPA: S8 family serine peptidase [Pseudobdellovibrionaceae bacterium]|nr:S8 family serine peptidase [Pseudobdellovibrionaceae bacterium]
MKLNQGWKLLVGAVAMAGSLASATAGAQERIPGEYLVKYKDASFTKMLSIQSTPSLKVMDQNENAQIMKVRVNGAIETRALAQLLSNPNVEYVVPNIKLRSYFMRGQVQEIPRALARLQDQYSLKKTNAEAAWAKAGNKGSKKIIVAVIDTGVDYQHDSLRPNMMVGYDFRENDADPMDKTSAQNPGHGTHCAGAVGASGLVDGGMYGLSPEVTIMPIRFLGEDGSGDLNNGIKSIDYAIQKGAHIISASWGAAVPRSQAQPLIEAVKRASDAGVTFIAAAANDGKNNDKTDVFPANAIFDNTISVAASDENDGKPSWSNYGKGTVHVAAPGNNIISTLPKNKYGKLSGTSMATPLVSGLAAFLKAQDNSLTGADLRAVMQHTGAKVNIDVACNCRVDALGAVETVLNQKMFVVPAAATMKAGDKQQFGAKYAKGALTYSVANTAIGDIDANGVFTAKADGETTVTVRDSSGQSSTSLAIRVGASSGGSNPGDPGDPGNGGECPLGDPMLCQIMCGIMPDAPWCQ